MFKISLDKWLKDSSKKKQSKIKERKMDSVDEEPKSNEKQILIKKSPLGKLQKFKLKCQNKKCGYQKTIVKLKLTKKNEICPKCSKTMKIQKL